MNFSGPMWACAPSHRSWIRPLSIPFCQIHRHVHRPSSRYTPNHASSASSPQPSNHHAWLMKQVTNNFIPISLVSAFVIGIYSPDLGYQAGKTALPTLVLVLIFLISGLQLKLGEASKELRAWKPLAFSIISLLLISPLILTPIVHKVGSLTPLHPSLLLGLCILMASPTALSSGTQLTALLGGPIALSILIVILSNSLACFSLPAVLPLALSGVKATKDGGIGLDPLALLIKLVGTCLLPTVFGASIRASRPLVASAVDGGKTLISFVSALCLATLPWIQISTLTISGQLATITSIALGSLLAISTILRILLLILNGMGSFFILDRYTSKNEYLKTMQVVILLSSQRTLPVALTLVASLSIDQNSKGFAALAMVVTHCMWLIIDSLIVSFILSRWGRLDQM